MIATSNNSSPKSYSLSPSQRNRHNNSSLFTNVSSAASPAPTNPNTASPKPSISIRSAPSSSASDSGCAPVSSIATPQHLAPAPPRSPKRPTHDSATQYSPNGLPPTVRPAASRSPSAQAQAIKRPRSVAETRPGIAVAASTDKEPATLAVQDSFEPQVRQPAQPAQSVTATARRTHSSLSATSGDVSTTPSSPTKRARKPMADAIVMPRDYAKCDPKELAVVISDMLLELIRVNDEIPLQDGQLTRFHSRAPPGISVRDYLHRLTYHATLPPPILLAMVTYVDKLCAMFPAFRINSLTVHRFLITAATVASKGLSDSFWTNSTYSKVGGVSIKELALLELELLERVEWRIVPQPEVLVDYYASLVERSEHHVLEDAEAAEP